MSIKEWNFKSFDNLEMYARDWTWEGKPKAVVVLIHGLGEHIGRYDHVAAALNQRGYVLTGFDLRGHGRSEGLRGHTPSLRAYYNDLDQFLSLVEERFPKIPRILYGHSVGGVLVLTYTPSRYPKVIGVVATAPAFVTVTRSQKIKLALANILGTLWPTFTLSNGLDPNTLSHDPEVVRAYVTDPLVHDRVTAGWGKATLSIFEAAKMTAADFPVPVLVMHGTEDKLGLPAGSKGWAEHAPADKCTLKMWEGLDHEIHNEPQKDQVLGYMMDWMDKLIPG